MIVNFVELHPPGRQPIRQALLVAPFDERAVGHGPEFAPLQFRCGPAAFGDHQAHVDGHVFIADPPAEIVLAGDRKVLFHPSALEIFDKDVGDTVRRDPFKRDRFDADLLHIVKEPAERLEVVPHLRGVVDRQQTEVGPRIKE